MDKIREEFEIIFDIPSLITFDGEDYMYYLNDHFYIEQCEDIQRLWKSFKYGYKSRDEEIKKAIKDERDSCILDITEWVHEWKKKTYVKPYIEVVLKGMVEAIRKRSK